MRFEITALVLALGYVGGFQTPLPVRHLSRPLPTVALSPLFESGNDDDEKSSMKRPSVLRQVLNRFDATEAAGLENVKMAGIFDKIKKLHGPKTYLVLSLLAGFKWNWCFRSPYYWLAVAFCVKWYRARYVFKIPVWDRQPNWNNIVTSKEQEKDLKAFTCKTCGSTIFIAKTREFFFEGDTGIGGLGCFSCGAKGKDNFVMDRDRIVEDVGDMDDYFEYERPLDFVSRAERRKLMKETDGDEDKANNILAARAATETEAPPDSNQKVNGDSQGSNAEVVEVETKETPVEEGNSQASDAEIIEAETVETTVEEDQSEEPEEDSPEQEDDAQPVIESSSTTEVEDSPETPKPTMEPELPKSTKSTPTEVAAKKSTPPSKDEELDVLDMDAF